MLARYETEAPRRRDGRRMGRQPRRRPQEHPVGPAHERVDPPPGDAPPLTTIRARTIRVCHHLAAGTRVDVLAAAGGFKNGNMGARYAGLLTAPPPNTAAAMLRDA